MEIIVTIIAYLIVGGIIFLYLGLFVFFIYMAILQHKIYKEEKKGNFYRHDGWEDGTWYGGS